MDSHLPLHARGSPTVGRGKKNNDNDNKHKNCQCDSGTKRSKTIRFKHARLDGHVGETCRGYVSGAFSLLLCFCYLFLVLTFSVAFFLFLCFCYLFTLLTFLLPFSRSYVSAVFSLFLRFCCLFLALTFLFLCVCVFFFVFFFSLFLRFCCLFIIPTFLPPFHCSDVCAAFSL